jgi:hypothetical protein
VLRAATGDVPLFSVYISGNRLKEVIFALLSLIY